MKDLARNNNNQIIEVYGKNPHLVCAYGIHKDGNPTGPYDTEEIAVIDDAKLLAIQNRIKSVIPDLGNVYDYSRNDNTAVHEYIQELKKPETIVQKGVVHDAVKRMMVSVYFSYTGEFVDMSDEARFQWVVNWDKQKALQAKRPAYIDANPEKMRKLWYRWYR